MRGVSAVSSDEGPCTRHASRALRRACGQGAVLSLCVVRPGSGRFGVGFWVGFWVGLRARDFPTERVLPRTPLIIRTVRTQPRRLNYHCTYDHAYDSVPLLACGPCLERVMHGVCAVSSDKGPCARHASRALRRACGQGAVLSLCMVRPGSGRFGVGFWVGFWVGLRARDFPTERVLSRTPLIIRTVDQKPTQLSATLMQS